MILRYQNTQDAIENTPLMLPTGDGGSAPAKASNGALVTVQEPLYSDPIIIPGIGTSAYASGDAFGTKFEVPTPAVRGWIYSLLFIDRDNEKIGKDFFLYMADFTATTDNSAAAPTDADALRWIGTVSLGAGDFYAQNVNALGLVTRLMIPYYAPERVLWCQCTTRGADNIAAGSEPYIRVAFL